MMLETSGGGGAKCFNVAANSKPCDSCKSAAALLFCREDKVFLCMVCDMKLHSEAKHERVWMCALCEQAPACVTCKADAAALCVTCDRDIHSVNPLARRHDRIPVVPFYDYGEAGVKTSAGNELDPVSGYGSNEFDSFILKEDHMSLGIPTDTTDVNVKFPSCTLPADMKMVDLFSGADRLFDFGFAVPTDVRFESQFHDSVTDCVVPTKNLQMPQIVHHQSPGTRYEINFPKPPTNSYNKSSDKLHSHNVSSSSMDASVVPEQTTMLNVSYPFILPVNGVVSEKHVGGTNETQRATGVDRMARVLRYREKRKNRKFEKKIRYASRKAYAEKRPRIKGRFVKRTESTTELNDGRWLFTAASNCNNYSTTALLPSF